MMNQLVFILALFIGLFQVYSQQIESSSNKLYQQHQLHFLGVDSSTQLKIYDLAFCKSNAYLLVSEQNNTNISILKADQQKGQLKKSQSNLQNYTLFPKGNADNAHIQCSDSQIIIQNMIQEKSRFLKGKKQTFFISQNQKSNQYQFQKQPLQAQDSNQHYFLLELSGKEQVSSADNQEEQKKQQNENFEKQAIYHVWYNHDSQKIKIAHKIKKISTKQQNQQTDRLKQQAKDDQNYEELQWSIKQINSPLKQAGIQVENKSYSKVTMNNKYICMAFQFQQNKQKNLLIQCYDLITLQQIQSNVVISLKSTLYDVQMSQNFLFFYTYEQNHIENQPDNDHLLVYELPDLGKIIFQDKIQETPMILQRSIQISPNEKYFSIFNGISLKVFQILKNNENNHQDEIKLRKNFNLQPPAQQTKIKPYNIMKFGKVNSVEQYQSLYFFSSSFKNYLKFYLHEQIQENKSISNSSLNVSATNFSNDQKIKLKENSELVVQNNTNIINSAQTKNSDNQDLNNKKLSAIDSPDTMHSQTNKILQVSTLNAQGVPKENLEKENFKSISQLPPDIKQSQKKNQNQNLSITSATDRLKVQNNSETKSSINPANQQQTTQDNNAVQTSKPSAQTNQIQENNKGIPKENSTKGEENIQRTQEIKNTSISTSSSIQSSQQKNNLLTNAIPKQQQIKALVTQAISAQKQKLNQLQSSLSKKFEELQKKQQTLKLKEQALNAKQSTKQQTLKLQEETLNAKSSELSTLSQTLKVKQQQLLALKNEVSEKLKQIQLYNKEQEKTKLEIQKNLNQSQLKLQKIIQRQKQVAVTQQTLQQQSEQSKKRMQEVQIQEKKLAEHEINIKKEEESLQQLQKAYNQKAQTILQNMKSVVASANIASNKNAPQQQVKISPEQQQQKRSKKKSQNTLSNSALKTDKIHSEDEIQEITEKSTKKNNQKKEKIQESTFNEDDIYFFILAGICLVIVIAWFVIKKKRSQPSTQKKMASLSSSSVLKYQSQQAKLQSGMLKNKPQTKKNMKTAQIKLNQNEQMDDNMKININDDQFEQATYIKEDPHNLI